MMLRNDYHTARPLGIHGKGHAWPIDPDKLGQPPSTNTGKIKHAGLGSDQTARQGRSMHFVHSTSDTEPSSLRLASIPMRANVGPSASASLAWSSPTDTAVPWQHDVRGSTVNYTTAEDPWWSREETLHDVSLAGDSCLLCATRAPSEDDRPRNPGKRPMHPEPGPSVSASQAFMRDVGGSITDP